MQTSGRRVEARAVDPVGGKFASPAGSDGGAVGKKVPVDYPSAAATPGAVIGLLPCFPLGHKRLEMQFARQKSCLRSVREPQLAQYRRYMKLD